MLTDEERPGTLQELEMQLLQSGVGAGALISIWIGLHGTRTGHHSRFDVWASLVLRYCERHGWIERPAVLLRLLDGLAQSPKSAFGPQIPGVRARIAEIGPTVLFPENVSAYHTCLLSLALPFLGRSRTRSAVENFDTPLPKAPAAKRVLVVNGPPGSGKSFTAEFLRMLAGLRQDQGIAESDFGKWAGKSLGPDVLVAELARQMKIDLDAVERIPDMGSQRPDRWGKDLALWLEKRAIDTGKTWSIVLDNFHRKGVPDFTHIFIEQLQAGLAGRGVNWASEDRDAGPPLRLVLLGYTRPLKERTSLVEVEDIAPITTADLQRHFASYSAFKGWPADPAELKKIASRYEPYLAGLFPEPPPTEPDSEPAEAPRWKMRELAEVVLKECADQERQRSAGQPATPPPAPPAGGNGNG